MTFLSMESLLVIALGNPGEKYHWTRHNAGFLALDFLYPSLEWKKGMKAKEAIVQEGNKKIFFIKPETFMNKSGEALEAYQKFYKIPSENILFIFDDIDLKLGKIRFRQDGRAGTHNGVKSILEKAGSEKIARIKIGIESREVESKMPLDAFVLEPFKEEEKELLRESFKEVSVFLESFLKKDLRN